ncbi:Peptidase M54 archaemetzincin [Pyrenophora seminiperda CCB06]|uniref:Peptidase M54 archaemetzincin n=1 Tax=Pyrenophora seminiperda CCB06 TaxID=1302712 RepID=A0A3M7LWA7_9PLEO|nr:Peptidase M54 archaemetzincin [Pyrenophora seminiperda CCB06]
MTCKHTTLQLEVSPFAELAGYEQVDARTRAAAETTSGVAPKTSTNHSNKTFPPPLILPHDELNYDPDCSPQSTKSWLNEKARNKVLSKTGRNTIYIARVPQFDKAVSFMRDWTKPKGIEKDDMVAASPDADLFSAYLEAFYHNMSVRILPEPLVWTTWNGEATVRPGKRATFPKYVGLAQNDQCTRIRVRRPPDSAFPAQLNLDDILDMTISILPQDAYAMVLLVDHDIYESEEDDFCCGRAYGGSRVAVVQTARYNPVLDRHAAIDAKHMWPLSHCKHFVDGLCAVEEVEARPVTKRQRELSKDGAMRKAVDAALEFVPSSDAQDVESLWFSRLARTVSHELGHCFGLAHCVYYACNMQSTGSMKEDVRQPPYLCPVCEAKVGHAIVAELNSGGAKEREEWIRQRCIALDKFCGDLRGKDMDSAMWRGLKGWLRERIMGL